MQQVELGLLSKENEGQISSDSQAVPITEAW